MDNRPLPPRVQSYVLCTAPRSGSTLLCKMLHATGTCGDPRSYFHRPSLQEWCKANDVSRSDSELETLRAVIEKVLTRGRNRSPIFGLRLQAHSFPFFNAQLALLHPEQETDLDRIRAVFGQTQFIHLTREDKLRQAISYVIAEQSGLWHRRADGSELERLSPEQDPTYDNQAIQSQMTEFMRSDAAWTEWFTTQGISPLRLTYEELSENPQIGLSRVLQALGLDPSAASAIPVKTAKLADQRSEAWRMRFMREQNG